MEKVQTDLANDIDASGDRARLDEVAKKLVKHRVILAEILKECTDEFKAIDLQYIIDHCFVGEVRVDQVAVDQDKIDANSSIVGSNTEDASSNEGVIHFDLVFDAAVPMSNKIIRMIINVEIQVDSSPGYALITRAIYYLGRLISRQKGTVFQHDDYGKLQKVYSIWICPDPSKKNKNSIAEYGFTQTKVVGEVNEDPANYDKMKAIIISLNDDGMKEGENIIRLLSTLLSTTETIENRKQILEDEFNIPMSEEMKKEMNDMCNLGYAVENKGRQEGRQEGENKMKKDMAGLMNYLLSNGRSDDALKASTDENFLNKLLADFRGGMMVAK